MNQSINKPLAIIGLGNPGQQYSRTRHNIGFMVLDVLAEQYGASWQSKTDMEIAKITINGNAVLLIKPQTYMNDSGRIVPQLRKQGIAVQDTLVIHDELEKPFGTIALRIGGSARGHNGLRSLIAAWGENFARLRFGISRPEEKSQVGHYVLENFKESPDQMQRMVEQSIDAIIALYQ